VHLERSVLAYFVALPALNFSQFSRQVLDISVFRARNVLIIRLLFGFSVALHNLDI
jgi:hypothetical protein